MHPTLKLIAIRFTFLISVLFVIIFNNNAFTFFNLLTKFTDSYVKTLVFWLGNSCCGLVDLDAQPNGSGDTAYSYVALFCILILSSVATLIWSAVDRKRKSHDQLFYWLHALLRFYVGFMLIHYALAKLNDGQFPGPSDYSMSITYGDFSPMGLAWRFLGFSEGYKTFMFFAEMMGALLLFRKTATIGAFLCLMTCMNIMAINYFFDVPVKIISTGLVVMCLIILSPNITRLFNLFFMGKTVGLDPVDPPVFSQEWAGTTKLVLKYVMIFICAAAPFIGTMIIAMTNKPEEKTSIYNRFDIASVSWPEGIPPQSYPYFVSKWKYIGLDKSTYAFINYGPKDNLNCRIKVDEKANTLTFSFEDKPDEKYLLKYRFYAKDSLEIKGNFFGKPINMRLGKTEFELKKHDFRWINRHPDNK